MSSERQATAVEREAQVLELAKAGRSFREIATALGYAGPSSAHYAFKRAMQKTIQVPADEYRALHRARLEHVVKVLWPQVIRGDLASIDRLLKALSALAELTGINAPVKIDVRRIVDEITVEYGLEPVESAALFDDLSGHLAATKAFS